MYSCYCGRAFPNNGELVFHFENECVILDGMVRPVDATFAHKYFRIAVVVIFTCHVIIFIGNKR